MTNESSSAPAHEQRRLRQEALLVEYGQLQQEATDEARRMGVLAGLVYTGLLAGLGFTFNLGSGLTTIAITCMGTGAAIITASLVRIHIRRQGFMRTLMWARQRQIETELGLYKSRNAKLISESGTLAEACEKADEKQKQIIGEVWSKPGRRALVGKWYDLPAFPLLIVVLWLGGLAIKVSVWMELLPTGVLGN